MSVPYASTSKESPLLPVGPVFPVGPVTPVTPVTPVGPVVPALAPVPDPDKEAAISASSTKSPM